MNKIVGSIRIALRALRGEPHAFGAHHAGDHHWPWRRSSPCGCGRGRHQRIQDQIQSIGASSTDGSGQWARRVGFFHQQGAINGVERNSRRSQGATFVLCGTANQSGTDLSPSRSREMHSGKGGTDIVLAVWTVRPETPLWAAQVGGQTMDEDLCRGWPWTGNQTRTS